ncbi:uncharacterized protein LOC117341960 [Pecten maximus]|uniref:uncharacterized protein LOC117341960 n=1 Tax=Pecten maximus TaxID=6579 RepID=UPI0014585362|nr:uncharacterized protein LOC117341960 [Pecten maximus]
MKLTRPEITASCKTGVQVAMFRSVYCDQQVLGHRASSCDRTPNSTTQFFNGIARSMVHRMHSPMSSPGEVTSSHLREDRFNRLFTDSTFWVVRFHRVISKTWSPRRALTFPIRILDTVASSLTLKSLGKYKLSVSQLFVFLPAHTSDLVLHSKCSPW